MVHVYVGTVSHPYKPTNLLVVTIQASCVYTAGTAVELPCMLAAVAAAAGKFWLLLLLLAAAASKPGCMVHGMSLQQQQLLRACVRACVAACVIDTIYELTRRRRPRRGESNFRIEIFANIRNGQKDELGGQHAYPKCTFGSGWPNMPVF